MIVRGVPGRRPLERIVEAYLLACRTEGMSPNTVRWYDQKLSAFLSHLGEMGISPLMSAVKPDVVREFLASLQGLGRTSFTTRGYVQVLKGFGTWLAEEGYVTTNPLGHLRLPKVPK